MNYDNTPGTDLIIEIGDDPDNSGNKTLHFEHYTAPVGSARASLAAMYQLSGGDLFDQGYVKYRMRLSEGFGAIKHINQVVDWLMLSEWWEYGPSKVQQARWNFHIYKDWGAGQEPYWALLGQQMQPAREFLWRETNRTIPVPIDEWFTIEMFFKKGDSDNGRIWIAITRDGGERQVIFDVHNITQHPTNPQPLGDWAMFKLYTIQWLVEMMNNNGTPLGIHYDDFEYWSDFPSETTGLPTPTGLRVLN